MGKLVLADFSPAMSAWMRYTGGFVSYLIALLVLKSIPSMRTRFKSPFFIPKGKGDWILLFILGITTFCFSPLMQMIGLSTTRATDNALIIAMEPLITVILAWIFLKEGITFLHGIAFAVALAGFALLTGITPGQLTQGWDGHYTGNLILLLSLCGEGAYSILGRKLMVRYPPTAVFGSALAVGIGFLTLGLLLLCIHSPNTMAGHFTWRSALGLLWLGPLGSSMAYLYWMVALSKAPVASLALTLFIQPVFGSIWGYVFLGERLTAVQSWGGAFIILAILGQTWLSVFKGGRGAILITP